MKYVFAILLLSSPVFGQIKAKVTGEAYSINGIREVRSSLLNPANQVFLLPQIEVGLDLRPELNIGFSDHISTIIRPRLRPRYKKVNSAWSSEWRLRMDEAYAKFRLGESWTFAGGIHYLQWGPAELFSPSNPLVNFDFDQRSVLFRQRGNLLVEANYSFDASSFFSVLVEPAQVHDSYWSASTAFTPKVLFRYESLWGNSGGNSLGLVAGRMDRGLLFIGEYLSYYIDDTWSVYFDARHSIGSPASYPSLAPIGLAEAQVNSGSARTFGSLGVRYEGWWDVRLEYLYNGYGYSNTQWAQVTNAAPFISPAVLDSFSRPGLEFPRQHYVYLSMRTDKLGASDEWRLALRGLHSLGDNSGALFSALEWGVSEAATLVVEPMWSYGEAKGEFAQLSLAELFAELRWSF